MVACLLACVVVLWHLTDTNVLLYVRRCFEQGRLQVVLLCLRYVDTVAIGTWFLPSLRSVRISIKFKNRKKKEEK